VSNVVGLVAPPTAADEIRESVLRLLRKTLAEAEAGEIDQVVIIARCVDGDWIDRISDTDKASELIGRLEITKQEWINRYLRDQSK
jgi:hypothetical protein